jgi:tetratricopeptide (TPR) repeat protein
MTTDSLKKQARQHEQNEAWEKALQLYRRALDETEVGAEPEISLFNRVADLELRLGNVEAAIEQYERAIDLYLESDLPNNAIAICRKILRNVPGRAETFLRMGEIRANQGFGVDARQNVLTYAEMMEERGDSEAASRALEALVGWFPEDTEAQIFLGERLVGLGDVDGGVRHLLGAWRRLTETGSEQADPLAARIREIEPAAVFPEADDLSGEAGHGDAQRGTPASWGAMDLPSGGLGTGLAGGSGPVERFLVDSPEAGRTQGEEEGDDVSGSEPGLDAISFGEITLGTEEAGPPEAEVDEPEPAFPTSDGLEPSEPVVFRDEREQEDDTSSFPELPSFELTAEPDADVEAEGKDGWEDAGEDSDPLPLLGEGPPTSVEDEGASAPDPVAMLSALVDEAHAAGDRPGLLASLSSLAATLSRVGDEASAIAVHEQVLQLDPRNPDALAALGRAAPPSAPPPAVRSGDEAAGGTDRGGFVDLGALVLDDVEMPTTRWVVEDERSGDEDADFAHMLSKFKAKVAQHITRDDARASYDLGTAYREMGLTDEAIGMFQQALRSQPGHLASLEMLGQCFLDREEPEVALRVLERALKTGVPVEDDLLGIYYFLGVAHERAGNRAEAREFYEKVFSLDINFKDVTERLRALR